MHQPGEPSVEEILDSIKKVIARDTRIRDGALHPAVAETSEPSDFDEADEVLELAEDEIIPSADAEPTSNEDDLIMADAEPFGPWSEDDEWSRADEQPSEAGPLTNEDLRRSMQENFAALSMLSEPSAPPQIVRSGETSLEGLTREMLRPMLAEWLDRNLPEMVEKLVKAEIARIARKNG